MPRRLVGLAAAARAAAAATSSSSPSLPASSRSERRLFNSASPDASVARSLYRALLRVCTKLDGSETARALVTLPEELSRSYLKSRRGQSFLAPREIAAAALDRHFLRGVRFYDPRRSAGCSMRGAVRASFREEGEGGGGGDGQQRRQQRQQQQRQQRKKSLVGSSSSDTGSSPALFLDAGFSALRYLGGIASVAERHGLLSLLDPLPATKAAAEEQAKTMTTSTPMPTPTTTTLTQRLSSPSAGALLLPHPALRGAFARTPVLLLEVSPEEREGAKQKQKNQQRRRRRRRPADREGGAGVDEEASHPLLPPPPVRAAAGALGVGAVGLALGAPFAPLPGRLVSPRPKEEEEGEGGNETSNKEGKPAPPPRPLRVSDLARHARPLTRLARLVSDLSSRGCRRWPPPLRRGRGGGGGSSARAAGPAGLALVRRGTRGSGGGGGGGDEKENDDGDGISPSPSSPLLYPPALRRKPRPPSYPRTLSLSFSPVGERVADDGTVGPAGIAVTVGVVRERAGGRNGSDDDDSGFFAESDFEDDSDFSDDEEIDDPSIRPVIEAADRFETAMDRAFREEGISSSQGGRGGGGGGGDEDGDAPALRAALALGVDVSAFDENSNSADSSSSPPSPAAESRLLWGGPVPGLTALHSCEEAGGDAVVLRVPRRAAEAVGAGAEKEEEEIGGRRRRRQRRQRKKPLLSSSSSSSSPASSSPPPPTLFVDGDMRKLQLLSSSSASSSSSSSEPLLGARVFVGTSLWAPGQLREELAAGAWVPASAPPRSLLALLRAPRERRGKEEEEEGDGRVLWERSLRECGMGSWAKVPEVAVEEAARVELL